jgi:hypothetical protein
LGNLVEARSLLAHFGDPFEDKLLHRVFLEGSIDVLEAKGGLAKHDRVACKGVDLVAFGAYIDVGLTEQFKRDGLIGTDEVMTIIPESGKNTPVEFNCKRFITPEFSSGFDPIRRAPKNRLPPCEVIGFFMFLS